MRLSSKPLLKRAGEGISKTLSEILVCPISKQPLRYCKETNSLFSDSIAVSFPIKDGIPCLVPRDGKDCCVSSFAFGSSISELFCSYLSLNRKDELNASSPEDSLQSLGITSGDLAYFSVNPIAAFRFLFLYMLVQGQKGEQHEIGGSDTSDAVIERHGSLDSKAQGGETLETQELTSVEAMDIDTGSADVGGKRFSEPYFTRKLLRKEMGDDGYSYKFLDIAVHAVFIESGFGGINSISGTQVDEFRLPEEQASKNLVMSLCYTLPELLDGKNDGMNENDRSSMLYLENENFELWKIVKDGLFLPLLIDLCKKVGLFLPPCLMRLPTELKQKFVEEFGDGTGALGTVNWKEQFASCWENKKKRKRDVNAMARLSSSSALFLPNQEKFCLVFLHPMVVLVKDFLDFVEILLGVVMRLKRDLQQEKHNPRELQERHRKWIPHLFKEMFCLFVST
ncbi:hypothetical protein D5086_027858 [Populus alba]|uniref:Uncharacterized protein n=1 Tax=Populus alba TaxID=43335 RepID=A0ACC4AWH8_POPAL